MFYTLTVLTLLTGGLNARSLPKRATQTRRKQAYWGQKMVLTMGSTLARSAPTVPAAAVSNNGAHEHLKTALLELTQRNRQIDDELARMEGLQAEKEIISKQIDAVNVALQAFGG
jgi:hypothetical protein